MTDVIAHRGASAAFAENTLAAFEGARAMGADGVELDVRRTRDGMGLVHHDAALADGRLLVDLHAADVPDQVPHLGPALDACAGIMVNVEIKNVPIDPDFDAAQTMADLVVRTVSTAGRIDDVVVSSFGLGAIDRVHELEPRLRTAWLVVDRGDPADLIARAAAAGHHGIHPIAPMADAAFVERAHGAGLFVNVWTVDDPDAIRRLADLGVDGVVTNVPDVALAALGRP